MTEQGENRDELPLSQGRREGEKGSVQETPCETLGAQRATSILKCKYPWDFDWEVARLV